MARMRSRSRSRSQIGRQSATTNTSPSPRLVDFDEMSRRRSSVSDSSMPISYAALSPGGELDLSWIATQAFGLGILLATSILGAVYSVVYEFTWWRLPTFFIALSLFHFLEFWVTAYANTLSTRADSFILFNNGRAYTTAHTLATLEVVTSTFFPRYQATFSNPYTIGAGMVLIIVGQVTRTIAMAQCGTNFNHIVQQRQRASHRLVTDGIYRFMRHPSYFGFFWWALGTQLLVGNKFCFVGYMLVLWRFFAKRIYSEERFLCQFFGEEYVNYRKRTGTMIPFIR